MPLRPPVFIVGCPRSGTTFLYHLLLSAGGFAIYRTEIKAYTLLGPLAGHFRGRTARTTELIEKWLGGEDCLRSGVDPSLMRTRLTRECRSTGDFQRILMESICENQHAERWADCTPDNSLHIRAIKRDFPTAKFIHIIRDGRDVALSLALQQWIRPFRWDTRRSAVAAAFYWDWIVRKGRRLGAELGSDYIEIHYRDLVRQPGETLGRIGEVIAHKLDYDRIWEAGIGSVRRPNTSFPGAAGTERFNPVDRWRNAFSPDDLRTVESLIGRQLRDLGYDLVSAHDQLAPNLTDAAIRRLYQSRFHWRNWLKYHTALGRWLSSADQLDSIYPGEEDDRTLRPADNIAHIRGLVSGSAHLGDTAGRS